ncbi:MAG: hypothetical protein ACK4NX_02605, partial [Candidatus Paceibacteria bacterium]
PQAWGEYWLARYRDIYNLDNLERNLASIKKALSGTNTKILYSLELNDSVEGWRGELQKTRKQAKLHDPISDGRFLVWANDLFAQIKYSDAQMASE